MSGWCGWRRSRIGQTQVMPEHSAGPELPDAMVEDLRNFQGVAATLRFDDGALELESVGDAAAMRQSLFATDAGDDVLASLPADTAAAIGVGLQDGWAQSLLDQIGGVLGSGETPDQMVAQAEKWTGLALPEDLETLFGDSTVIAIGSDFDPEAFANSEDGSDIPVGIKVKGDAGCDRGRARQGPQPDRRADERASPQPVRGRRGRDRPQRRLPRRDPR